MSVDEVLISGWMLYFVSSGWMTAVDMPKMTRAASFSSSQYFPELTAPTEITMREHFIACNE